MAFESHYNASLPENQSQFCYFLRQLLFEALLGSRPLNEASIDIMHSIALATGTH